MSSTVNANTKIPREIIDRLKALPPHQRAAALSHLIYIETIKRPDVDWSTELADEWSDLDLKAQIFNEQLIEMWADNEQLFDLWIATIKGISRRRRAEQHAPISSK